MATEGDAKGDEPDRPASAFGPPVSDSTGSAPESTGPEGEFGPPVGEFGPPVGEFGPPMGEFGPPVGEFGPPVGEYGPPMGEFGRPMAESGPSAAEFGPPVGEFGPPATESGPSAAELRHSTTEPGQPGAEFGPPTAEFGAPVSESGAAEHPELIWRPADDTPAPPPQYRAPDSSGYPTPSQDQPDETERERWWQQSTDSGGVPVPPPPASPQSRLSWSEDPIAQRLAPGFQKPPPGQPGSKKRTWLIVLGTAAALAVIVGLAFTIVAVTRSGGGTETTAALVPTSTKAELSCPPIKDGKVTQSNGPGDTASGPGAILGFQYAFYVQRSGEQARKFVASDTVNVSTADIIQKAIDEQIPVGTTHCLRIVETAPETYDVDLTEHRPDGATRVYLQTVNTANRDGKELVYSIKNRGE
ncbi:hypothetical protein [Nocardia arthritidis]|uniref:DUF8176 domain-containing protein n=1 Tax=Nocardia arthritidis TaxID=228602 RepID=A0A6G9Y7M8_9NOCA|nr:hypothetical protein F5544_06555 [Nocardia arthritidis]